MSQISGVYIIRNVSNGKIYVGSSNNIDKRWLKHKWTLEHNSHSNQHLQAAWNRYGATSFKFDILEETAPENLLAREQVWLDSSLSLMPDRGYNKERYAGRPSSVRKPFSEATRLKMRQSALGRKMSLEARHNMSLAKSGRVITEEHKHKISVANKGRRFSESFKKRLSLLKTGTHLSEATKQKIRLAQLGRHPSVETRQKMSAARLSKQYSIETQQG